MPGLPFRTVVTLLSTICVSLKVSAAAMRASSCVNRSNRLRASSMSFLPISIFRYFSDNRLADIYASPRVTHSLGPASSLSLQSPGYPTLRSLFSRLYRSLRLSEALQYETRVARRSSRCSQRDLRGRLGSLRHPWLPVTDLGVIIASRQRSRSILTERRTPIPEKMAFAGENTWKISTKGVGVDRLTG